MGIHKSTYIGIYLEVSNKIVTSTKIVWMHPDAPNKIIKNPVGQYCPTDGKKYISKEISVEEILYATPYLEEAGEKRGLKDDVFCVIPYSAIPEKKGSTFIVNSLGKYNIDLDNDDAFNVDLSTIGDIKELISSFEKEYQGYLDYYRAEFGEVLVKYGVVNYFV